MSGALQAVFQNQRSFIVVPVVGSALGGGYFAGQISTAGNGIANYNLVVGPIASAQASRQWKTVNNSTAGTSSNIDGPGNSAAMNNATHPSAFFCEGLTVGGFTDWYMPAKNELEVCYYNLKPSTNSNNGASGVNPNAVPARASVYTPTVPARTSATAFQSGNAEAFETTTDDYWASTEWAPNPATNANQTRFTYGWQYYNTKSGYNKVRAVRRVAV
tara:strand:+ start:694 stop:1344 length:651 start_codon:yes stop_codon:yes gene_type:complete